MPHIEPEGWAVFAVAEALVMTNAGTVQALKDIGNCKAVGYARLCSKL